MSARGRMAFPVELNFFSHRVPFHGVMELAGYFVGVQLYFYLRRRRGAAALPVDANLWIIVGCVMGAVVGSKLLAWAESPLDYWQRRATPLVLLSGKTIVGGLLGGWIGVELVKKKLGVRQATGDLFVPSLIVGMCIGRVGCFLTGLADHTHGVHSSLPWAVDFGDGPRHPTQLYEIVFLIVLGIVLFWRSRSTYWNGELFQWFMFGYLGFRFLIEFIKPRYLLVGGLSAIQLAAALGILECVRRLARGPVEIPVTAAMTSG